MLSERQAPAPSPPQPHPVSRTVSLHSTLRPRFPHFRSAQCMKCNIKDAANAIEAKEAPAPCSPQPHVSV
eukprot:1606906-Alexandrium_andersonii.AAC.1